MTSIFKRSVRKTLPSSLARFILGRHAKSRLDSDGKKLFDNICSAIDVDRMVSAFSDSESDLAKDPAAAAKYFDHYVWLTRGIQDAVDLGLHRDKNRRVLDIGCGPGWFIKVCAYLGHECAGTDLSFDSMRPTDRIPYAKIPEMLGCSDRIVREPVKAYTPIPLEGPFDLVTCLCICFDGHWEEVPWGASEWTFFLDDVDRLLAPQGRLYLRFNRKPRHHKELIFYDQETQLLLESRGTFQSAGQIIVRKRRIESTARGET